MPINTVVSMDLSDFNTDFAAQVQYLLDNINWHSDLDAQDKARFATALVLSNMNVRVYDSNGDIFRIQNP